VSKSNGTRGAFGKPLRVRKAERTREKVAAQRIGKALARLGSIFFPSVSGKPDVARRVN
jgi:hypothetical protein